MSKDAERGQEGTQPTFAPSVFFHSEVLTTFVEVVLNSNSSNVVGVPKGISLGDNAAFVVKVDEIVGDEGDGEVPPFARGLCVGDVRVLAAFGNGLRVFT